MYVGFVCMHVCVHVCIYVCISFIRLTPRRSVLFPFKIFSSVLSLCAVISNFPSCRSSFAITDSHCFSLKPINYGVPQDFVHVLSPTPFLAFISDPSISYCPCISMPMALLHSTICTRKRGLHKRNYITHGWMAQGA